MNEKRNYVLLVEDWITSQPIHCEDFVSNGNSLQMKNKALIKAKELMNRYYQEENISLTLSVEIERPFPIDLEIDGERVTSYYEILYLDQNGEEHTDLIDWFDDEINL